MKIVLASASPRRKMLLEQIGIIPEILPSGVEETVTKIVPEEVVKELSERKAEDVASGYGASREDVLVIGADTVVAAGDVILGKPVDRTEAVKMISMLAGGTHQVCTGVTVIRMKDGKTAGRCTFAEKTYVSVYPMTREEIEAYVDSGEPMDKAGAYGIQGRFAAYIKGISGDYSNVVGLPVGRLYQELKKWNENAPGGNLHD
ncbi:Maf family protein [Clostridium sp. AM58-1XD]|uniref:Maf family protein n=1 Tax=Clostridium sp. AM58-1XD TaxID=2292307 RepID=UPI0026AC5E6D